MKRFVYLAGPIAACTHAEATDWRASVAAQLQARRVFGSIVAVSPMRMKDWTRRMERIEGEYQEAAGEDYRITGAPMAIRTRDHFDVKNADMLFVYLPREMIKRRPSWGTAIEIGWASAYQKPIVLVTDDANLANHPLILGSVGWIVPTLEEGIEATLSVLGAYT